MKPSIKEIAREAGVSITTVSRVINNSGYVSQSARAKVKEAINRTGFVPNVAARSLRTRQFPIVGVMIPDITNEFFARIVQAIQKKLLAYQYSTIIYNTDESAEIERACLDIMLAQNVQGLIVISSSTTDAPYRPRIPTVYVDRRPSHQYSEDTMLVEIDNDKSSRLAIGELVHCGCKRIALVTHTRDLQPHSLRIHACIDEMKRLGLTFDERLLLKSPDLSFQQTRRLVAELIESGIAFDGVFCMSDAMAMGALTALTAHNVAVPQSVRVIGFDDVSIAQLGVKPLTTIHQPLQEMGSMAAEMLYRALNEQPVPNRHMVFPATLVRRTTT